MVVMTNNHAGRFVCTPNAVVPIEIGFRYGLGGMGWEVLKHTERPKEKSDKKNAVFEFPLWTSRLKRPGSSPALYGIPNNVSTLRVP